MRKILSHEYVKGKRQLIKFTFQKIDGQRESRGLKLQKILHLIIGKSAIIMVNLLKLYIYIYIWFFSCQVQIVWRKTCIEFADVRFKTCC